MITATHSYTYTHTGAIVCHCQFEGMSDFLSVGIKATYSAAAESFIFICTQWINSKIILAVLGIIRTMILY